MENTQFVSPDSSISASPSPQPSARKPWKGVVFGILGVFVLGGGVTAYFVMSGVLNPAAGIPIPTFEGTLAFRVPEAALMANATYTKEDGQIVHYIDKPSVIEKAWTEENHHILIKFTDAFGVTGEVSPEAIILGRAFVRICQNDTTHVKDAWYYVYTSPTYEVEKTGTFPTERFLLGNCRDILKTFEEKYTGRPKVKAGDLVYVAIPPAEVTKLEAAKHGGGTSGKLRAATSWDTDDDGLLDLVEESLGSKATEYDTDLDGVGDSFEIVGGEYADEMLRIVVTDTVLWSNPDTDGDGLGDALELGFAQAQNPDPTKSTLFVADSDPLTVTKPNVADTDGGGKSDGEEDSNKNGKVDEGETDPNNKDDDVAVPLPPLPDLGGGSGDLYVAMITPVPSHQLLGGEVGEGVMRLRFNADKEDIDVTYLRIASEQNPVSVDVLELVKIGEAQPFAVATRANCGTLTGFCVTLDQKQLVVPAGVMEIMIQPRLKNDEVGATSGEQVKLSIKETSSVRARGVRSAKELKSNDGDETAEGEIFIGRSTPGAHTAINAPVHTVVLSKVLTIANGSSEQNEIEVPNGVKTIGQFKFTAATNRNTTNGLNKIELRGIVFSVQSSNVQFGAGKFKLFNTNDQVQKFLCTESAVTGDFLVKCNPDGDPAVDLTLDSGENLTVVLEAEIVNNQVSSTQSSSLQVALENFSGPLPTIFGTQAGESHIHWSDGDMVTKTSFLWIESNETRVTSTKYTNGDSSACGNGVKEGTEECDEKSSICTNDCKKIQLPEL